MAKRKGTSGSGEGQYVITQSNLDKKGKTNKKVLYYELSDELERELEGYICSIETLLEANEIPEVLNKTQCKKCAYYEYCYI